MENRLHPPKTSGKLTKLPSKKLPLVNETKMARDTATPEENDPAWDELGSTRIVKPQADSVVSGESLSSPSNFTEMSPSRVLGKNLVQLGDFQLKKKLGEGAMGAVYKAVQLSYNRTVALKVLFPHVANNPKLVERLYREGRVMGQLDHPNIVQAYAMDESEGCHYVAMEYVSGQSMQKWLSQLGRLPVPDAVQIILDCTKALAYAHKLNMVHRDIKPDNILLTKAGIVKVADFGMVKIDDDEMALTQTGHAVGTPWYMPLEQARNAKEIDGRSDIYALGCTLYAFLTGHPPFVGRTIVEVIQAKELGTFPTARQTNRGVPERLDLIIAKMTSKYAKNRYQTCDEVIKDLESLNFASGTISFLQEKTVTPEQEADTISKMQATVANTLVKSQVGEISADATAPPLDPNAWYMQVKSTDGSTVARKYTTSQLVRMLTEGTIKPTAQISRSSTEGFRALATFKEFQGNVLGKVSKKGADKQTARYRGIYKKIEEKERKREQKERADTREESQVQATTRYWLDVLFKVLPIGLGFAFFISIILAIVQSLWWLPIGPGVIFFASLGYYFMGKR